MRLRTVLAKLLGGFARINGIKRLRVELESCGGVVLKLLGVPVFIWSVLYNAQMCIGGVWSCAAEGTGARAVWFACRRLFWVINK